MGLTATTVRDRLRICNRDDDTPLAARNAANSMTWPSPKGVALRSRERRATGPVSCPFVSAPEEEEAAAAAEKDRCRSPGGLSRRSRSASPEPVEAAAAAALVA